MEPLPDVPLAAETADVDEFSLIHRTVLLGTRGVPGRPIPTGRPAPTLVSYLSRGGSRRSDYLAPKALPALRRTTSPSYRIPLPL